MGSLVEELVVEMGKMPAIDAHEHFEREESLVAEQADVFTRLYVSYIIGAAVSAGWRGDRDQLTDTSKPLVERWRLLSPWVDAIEDSGVAWAAHIAARDLFGFTIALFFLNDGAIKLSNLMPGAGGEIGLGAQE